MALRKPVDRALPAEMVLRCALLEQHRQLSSEIVAELGLPQRRHWVRRLA